MGETLKVVKVFLGSPGDLPDERAVAKAVIDETNKNWARAFGYQLELIRWEESIPAYGRPQDIINVDLDTCELFVGMMWKRWGSRPGGDEGYTAGFEEEYERSIKRRRETGSPDIVLLFRDIDQELIRDAGPDLTRVIAFKNSITEGKEVFSQPFVDPSDFEGKFRTCIAKHVLDLHRRELLPSPEENESGPKQQPPTGGAAQQSPQNPLSSEGSSFLHDLLNRSDQGEDDDAITDLDVARLRLLASSTRRPGNDDARLGVHDANLLFENAGTLQLSLREKRGLLRCGLSNARHEVVPLWHWFSELDGQTRWPLAWETAVNETADDRAGALSAMRLIRQPLPHDSTFNRAFYLDSWFKPETAANVKIAALKYLGDCGLDRDLPVVAAEIARADYRTTSSAIDAYLRITLRYDHRGAIVFAINTPFESLDESLLKLVFQSDSILSSDELLKGLKHRSAFVRSRCLILLMKSSTSASQQITALTGDPNPRVRLEVTKWMNKTGLLSDEEAHKIIKGSSRNHLSALSNISDIESEKCITLYRRAKLAEYSERDLVNASKEDPIFDTLPYLVLVDRFFKKYKPSLVHNINDMFVEYFDDSLRPIADRQGWDSTTVNQIRGLSKYIRGELTRSSIEIIARRGDADDLTLVRTALNSDLVEFSESTLQFLTRFGHWEDIPVIDKIANSIEGHGTSLLGGVRSRDKLVAGAKAIYQISKSRLQELIEIEISPSLLAATLVQIVPDRFALLADETIIKILLNENDEIRKAGALKAVQSLPKRRIRQLLRTYIRDYQRHFYNVAHWLDLGGSLPKSIAINAARCAMHDASWLAG